MIRKKYQGTAIFLTVLLLTLALNTACEEPFEEPYYEKFVAFSPYEPLSDEDITYLKENFSLPVLIPLGDTPTDAEIRSIADAIKTWLGTYMKRVSPEDKPDLSYPMRWNNIMPGVYPVTLMIRTRHIQDGDVNKLYGLCWDYATLFKALADHYGLKTRITAYKMYMADDYFDTGNLEPTPDRGMSPEESSALISRLSALGFTIPEYILSEAMLETYVHYRPEVSIGGSYESYDAPGQTGEFAVDSNFSLVNWYDGLNSRVAYR